MQRSENPQVLETKLIAQISDISNKINMLTQERQTLDRILIQVRRQRVVHIEAVRSSSAMRILVHDLVVNTLTDSKNGYASSRILFGEVKKLDLKMNPSTFRSHLHRLKKIGVICNFRQTTGLWTLPPDPKDK